MATTPIFPNRGSLILFHYQLWKNDPAPLVIVSSVTPGYVVKGVNLHYLTFNYINRIIASVGPGFSYNNIRGDQYIMGAFRSYLWSGIDFKTMRSIDTGFLLKMMSSVRSFDPNQIRAMRMEIDRQISQQMQQPVAMPGTTEVGIYG